MATTGIVFISAMQTTRIMSRQLVRKASITGERGTAWCSASSAKAGVSSTSRRMIQPAMITKTLSRNGMRQPQEAKALSGMKCASGRKTAAARIWPACTPCRVKLAKKPRRPNGACSRIIELAPEISPATAKPWTAAG